MADKLQWGIISTGRIAGVFAKALADSKTGELLAVASRTQEAADKFGNEYNVPRRYGNYQALLDDPDVQAVYIATPHPMHAEWAVKAAESGKHILCEKPLTINFPEAMAVIEAARRNDVFLMEAFMYRCHPQTAKLVELVRSGIIGEVRMIQATFSFNSAWNPEGRLLNPELGGGGILDVGCYPISMSRLIAGAAMDKPFAEPVEVKGIGHIGETGVDEWAAGILRFEKDIIAQVATGVRLAQENVVRIYGSEGSIFVPSPWFCQERAEIIVARNGQQQETVLVESKVSSYTFEADTVAANIEKRQAPSPAMSWEDSLGNMRTLDTWRLAIGLTYPQERLGAEYSTIDRRPLSVRSDSKMKYGHVEHINKPVSRLVMGAMLTGSQLHVPHTHIMYDEFFLRGGNCFDTAYIYGGGLSDQLLGQWMKNRGIRDKVVVLAKGAHTPHCYPEFITSQLFETLERLQTDYVDLYMMHRDNPEVPVGEFIDVLNEHVNAGRIKAFGGSNWPIERVEEANAYARSKGLRGFSAVSNNFSLAEMVKPVWEGCIHSSDIKSRAWFEKNQMPLFAWSSLARGFFVKGDPNYTDDQSLVASWYSEDNFRRLERAKELATKKSVEPVVIAMAYVLSQPFPTFALFGPANIEEMRISFQGLELELTPDELRWLNLESE
jgi:predicted dehydrogenase/aryl-alcohol dehydrogenase-like predicted oxidoreductase